MTQDMITRLGGKLVYIEKPGRVVEITDIEVEPGFRRQGIGSAMIRELRERNRGIIHAFTRRTNGEARLFYKSLGFFPVVVPGYYDGGDAVLFIDKERP